MTIKITLIKSLIVEAVKNVTFLKGKIDEANPQLQAMAYNEQAGDDTWHERIIERNLFAGVEKVKSFIIEHLASIGATIGDNDFTLDTDDDQIIILFNVPERFNVAQTSTLSQLMAKCVEDYILYNWYAAINVQQSEVYLKMFDFDAGKLMGSFSKTAPSIPQRKYTSEISVEAYEDMDGIPVVTLDMGQDETLTYHIEQLATDDITAVSLTPELLRIRRSPQGLLLHPLHPGIAKIKLYSIHNDSVNTFVFVKITGEDVYDRIPDIHDEDRRIRRKPYGWKKRMKF